LTNVAFTPVQLATVLSLVELPFLVVKPDMFVASKEGDETLYGRVVTLLRVEENPAMTLDDPQVVDLALL